MGIRLNNLRKPFAFITVDWKFADTYHPWLQVRNEKNLEREKEGAGGPGRGSGAGNGGGRV
jgi:hypothetical protein